MRSEIVNAILGICVGLPRNNHCPHNYELSIDDHKQMVQLLCTDVEVEDINDSELLDLVFTSSDWKIGCFKCGAVLNCRTDPHDASYSY